MLSLQNAHLAFGGPALLDAAALDIFPSERIGLVGRNGTGKSTLLRVLAGEQALDSGNVVIQPDCRMAYLPQTVPTDLHGSVMDIICANIRPTNEPWQRDAILDKILRATELDTNANFPQLSAGMKRRCLIARALAGEPDLLLLDEPTNHLDIPSIRWLERTLLGSNCALLFVTHDRAFLQNLATRILDLERGRLSSWDCDYPTYMIRKEQWLAAEEKQNAVFDKKLSQEEAWIRQGIKARRTRNEGRVRQLEKMRQAHRERRNRSGNVRLQIDATHRSGVKVIDVKDLQFKYDDQFIIRDFTLTIERGDKIGIVGPNGAGKSTLIQLLLGKLAPHAGSVSHGTQLQIAYFDQLRAQLNPALSVMENVADGADSVVINGRSQHIISYLKDFLFPADRARSPVSMLSGGELNRLLLARLFTAPFNLLVMDEPTNDLDLETLELLEERLADFQGTLLLVSHDRSFLNNVVTDLLILEGDGHVHAIVGGYNEYLQWRDKRSPVAARDNSATAKSLSSGSATAPRKDKPAKLSNKQRAALLSLPKEIEALELEQQQLLDNIADPGFYQRPAAEITAAQLRLQQIESEILEKFSLWESLETAAN